jgi:predicted murein hydrolase (TIGR00659 family)
MSGVLLWSGLTLAVYVASRWLYARRRTVLLNPVLVSIVVVIVVVVLSGTPYDRYAAGARPISALLGLAVVALGVPLCLQLHEVRRRIGPSAAAVSAGSIVGVVAATLAAALLGAPVSVVRSLAPRSVTTPIAIAISARLGGIPALSAAVVIATGLVGGVIGPALLRLVKVRGAMAVGLALGSAAHGLGTARAVEEGHVEGAASGLAMGLNGIATAIVAPLVMWVLRRLGLG